MKAKTNKLLLFGAIFILLAFMTVECFAGSAITSEITDVKTSDRADIKEHIEQYWNSLPEYIVKEENIVLTKNDLYPYIEHTFDKYERKGLMPDDKILDGVVETYTVNLLSLMILDRKVNEYINNNEDSSGTDSLFFPETKPAVIKNSLSWRKGDLLKNHRTNLIRKAADKLKPYNSVNQKELEDYYNKNKDKWLQEELTETYHIMIEPDKKRSWDQAEKLAEEIYNKIKNGGNFSEYAEKYNKRRSKELGGYLGVVKRGTLTPKLDKAFWELVPDHLNEPVLVKSDQGWHIIKVTEYSPEKHIPLDVLKEDIKITVQNEKITNTINKLMDESYELSRKYVKKN